jgi:hypothetical protein
MGRGRTGEERRPKGRHEVGAVTEVEGEVHGASVELVDDAAELDLAGGL